MGYDMAVQLSELLFYGGIAMMIAAALAAAVAGAVLRASGKRLDAQMDLEYGRKKR